MTLLKDRYYDGLDDGKADCEATHDRLLAAAISVVAEASEQEYESGTQDAYARGRQHGALWTMGVCLGLAVLARWWRAK